MLSLAHPCAAGSLSDSSQFVNLERLSDRVLLGYWVGLDRRCNLTAIKTEKGLVIVDTELSPRIMAPVKAKLENAFGRRDWTYVINTHAHDSHPGGNSLFPGAVIVGHQNLEEDMRWIIRRQSEPDWKSRDLESAARSMQRLRGRLDRTFGLEALDTRKVRAELKYLELHAEDLRLGYPVLKPTLTFTNTHRLQFGDVELELIFFGKGHSISDTLVYVPQEKLLVTGAIVYQRWQFPEIGEQTQMEDVERFLSVLDRFLAPGMELRFVVPSHSPPLQKGDLEPVRDYYRRMLAGVRSAQRSGLSFEQAKFRLGESRFTAFRAKPRGTWSYGMHQRNLRNLWRIVAEQATNLPSLNARVKVSHPQNVW